MLVVVLLIIFALLAFLPSVLVNYIIKKYHSPKHLFPFSGHEYSKTLLGTLKLEHVQVIETDKGDHYDPEKKIVALSKDTFQNSSLSAITIATHEVSHALQHAQHYRPLVLRTRLVKLIMPLEKIGAGLLFLSPLSILITRMPILGMLIFLGGFLTLFTSILVHAVTLPTEIDASFNKAIPLLEKSKILTQDQLKNSKKILLAAAFTYIAVALRSLLDIARWWAILRRR